MDIFLKKWSKKYGRGTEIKLSAQKASLPSPIKVF